eukprot:31252_1
MEQYSYGFRFYYWKYYKYCQDRADPVSEHSTYNLNTIDFKHHTNTCLKIRDWYIEPMHTNIKSELICNSICCIGAIQWKTVLNKVGQHYDTDRAKSTVCIQQRFAAYYGIKCGDFITINHLISMMVYCNFSLLSYRFTETYRRIYDGESNQFVKRRHQNYYWIGKYLRECVECFGMQNELTMLKVYHGVNKKFMFSSMNAYIMCPFSTTRNYAVAVNFGGSDGMILELDIDMMQAINLCDMRYVSDYCNEEEIFSIGRLYPFSFNTIIETNGLNYSMYMIALKQITNALELEMKGMKMLYELQKIINKSPNESDMYSTPRSKDEKQMFFRLLSHRIWKMYPSHRYAYEFKNCAVYFKKIFSLHLDAIRMVTFDRQNKNKIIDKLFRYENGWINLDLLTKIFPNIHFIAFVDLEKDLSFLTDPTIYQSVLSFVELDRKYILNHVQLRIHEKYYEKMRKFLSQFEAQFARCGWVIGVKKQVVEKDIWNRMNLSSLLTNTDTTTEQKQMINLWMNKLRNSVGVVNGNGKQKNVCNGCITTIYMCTTQILQSYHR